MISSWKYKNIVFRYITELQLPEIVNMLHDPEVEKYLWFAPITLEAFREYAIPIIEGQKKSTEEGKYPYSAIFTITVDDEIIGNCGISQMQDAHNTSLIGYQLKRSAWGKGIATSSLEFLIHYAKTYLKLRKLFGDCMSENIGSVKVMEKCGFSYEGTIKEKYELNGVLHDNSWFGLRIADAVQLDAGGVEEIS